MSLQKKIAAIAEEVHQSPFGYLRLSVAALRKKLGIARMSDDKAFDVMNLMQEQEVVVVPPLPMPSDEEVRAYSLHHPLGAFVAAILMPMPQSDLVLNELGAILKNASELEADDEDDDEDDEWYLRDGGFDDDDEEEDDEDAIVAWEAIHPSGRSDKGTTLPALTIHQPLASMIVKGELSVEERKSPTDHRGFVLVHAASTLGDEHRGNAAIEDMPRGAIIGIVDLVNCTSSKKGGYGWQFANPRIFQEPIPYKGAKGIFRVPSALVTKAIIESVEPAQPAKKGRRRLQ